MTSLCVKFVCLSSCMHVSPGICCMCFLVLVSVVCVLVLCICIGVSISIGISVRFFYRDTHTLSHAILTLTPYSR